MLTGILEVLFPKGVNLILEYRGSESTTGVHYRCCGALPGPDTLPSDARSVGPWPCIADSLPGVDLG